VCKANNIDCPSPSTLEKSFSEKGYYLMNGKLFLQVLERGGISLNIPEEHLPPLNFETQVEFNEIKVKIIDHEKIVKDCIDIIREMRFLNNEKIINNYLEEMLVEARIEHERHCELLHTYLCYNRVFGVDIAPRRFPPASSLQKILDEMRFKSERVPVLNREFSTELEKELQKIEDKYFNKLYENYLSSDPFDELKAKISKITGEIDIILENQKDLISKKEKFEEKFPLMKSKIHEIAEYYYLNKTVCNLKFKTQYEASAFDLTEQGIRYIELGKKYTDRLTLEQIKEIVGFNELENNICELEKEKVIKNHQLIKLRRELDDVKVNSPLKERDILILGKSRKTKELTLNEQK
jgi:hypothetical protein